MAENLKAIRVAEGRGWHVQDVICHAGPEDAPYEEQHETIALAAVLSGTFTYRTREGKSLLAPGAVLLGNHGRCFECGHDHSVGDRCLSFHFTGECWEEVASAVSGHHKGRFDVPSLPPTVGLLPVTAAMEAGRALGRDAMEEIAFAFAGAVLRLSAQESASVPASRRSEERRIAEAVHRIEQTAHDLDDESLALGSLAREAGMSRYHFLRCFRRLVGMTPHQYVLHRRMQRAAVFIRTTTASLTAVALEAGFSDYSTFVRRFRAVMGVSPGEYRRITTR